MVHIENGMSNSEKAERKAMPVTTPGKAMGRMTAGEMLLASEEVGSADGGGASVPAGAITVAIVATLLESASDDHTSGAVPCHCRPLQR